MSNEEMNKKMEFIVEHQAQFAADIQVMREVQAVDSRLIKDGLIGLIDIVGHLARSHMRTEDTVKLLTEAQARTEESVKILVNTVERHLGGNGPGVSPA